MRALFIFFLSCLINITSLADTALWDKIRGLTVHLEGRVNYNAKMTELKTLVSPALLTLAFEEASRHPGETYVFHDENGNILISPERILVTNSDGAELYKLSFHKEGSLEPVASSTSVLPRAISKEAGSRLAGERVILDSITKHPLLNEKRFGTKTFTEFTTALHQRVKADLEKEGATVVSLIRPALDHEGKPKTLTTLIAEQNQTTTPFSVALSLQFSADEEDFVVTFFDGNIGVGELKSETAKSSFVYRLLTGKVVQSALLSKCLACSLKAGLEQAHMLGSKSDAKGKPIASAPAVTQEHPTGKTYFEGNARALTKAEFAKLSGSAPEIRVKAESLTTLSAEDPEETYELGFAARDLWLAKLTALSSAVIFPNYTIFQQGDIEANIDKYSSSIVEGLIKFVQ